jgi:hypothetical protein
VAAMITFILAAAIVGLIIYGIETFIAIETEYGEMEEVERQRPK